MKLRYIIVILFIVLAVFIITTNNLNLKDSSDRKTFIKTYTGYITKVGKNIKDLTKQAIQQDWRIKNETTKINGWMHILYKKNNR